MHGAICSLLCSGLLLIASAVAVHAEKRVALVIGNDDYTQVPKLQKAVNEPHAPGDGMVS